MAGLRLWAAGLSAFLLIGASVHAFCDYPFPAYGQMMAPIYATYPISSRPYCPCIPEPPRYACPSPAPSSPGPGVLGTHEPPLANKPNKGPTIYQNRTFSGVPQSTEPRTANCKVSFWNLSGLDVKLTVGEREHAIPKDRAVILDLERHFTWRTNFHNPKAEEVADDLNHFEVMIR